MNMDRLSVNDRSTGWHDHGRLNGSTRYWHWPVIATSEDCRHQREGLGVRCITEPRGILRNRIQHRLNIGRRAGDDA